MTLEPFLEWLEALAAAIDLSPSLEERSLPRIQTLPRRRRRRNQATGSNTTTQQAGSQESSARQEGERDVGDEPIVASEAVQAILEARRRANNTPEEAFDEEGKWCPRRRITPEANLRYAKRCMAVLCGDAPRQSDFVVVHGTRYRLSWAKRKMIPDACGPIQEVSDNKGKRPATATGTGDDNKAAQKLPKLPEYDEIMGLRQSREPLAATTIIY